MPQKQIKITISEKLHNIIDEKARKLGVKPSEYCKSLVFEHIRDEVEKND